MNNQDQTHLILNSLQSLSERIYKHEQDQLCCYDLSASECHALRYLRQHRERDVTINELGEYLKMTRSGATRLTDKLYGKGYVVKKNHPTDGRACCVLPTPKGIHLSEKIETEAAEQLSIRLSQLDPLTRQIILSSLQLLESVFD